MSDLQIRGPVYGGTGAPVPYTAGKDGGQRVNDAHGRYWIAADEGRLFWAASQAATAWSVALTATYTGLVLSNPAGSKFNLVPYLVGFGLSVAPAAIASIGIITGYAAGGLTAHTTPLTVVNGQLDSETGGSGKADAAATLVGTPRWSMPLMGGFTAAALPSTSPSVIDLGGAFVIRPGAYLGIGALTAVTGFGGIVWEEVPIVQ